MKHFQKNEYFSEYSTMPVCDKADFNRMAAELTKEKEYKHLDKEWGRFEGLKELDDAEITKLANEVIAEMSLEQKVNQLSCDLEPWELEFAVPRYNFTPYFAGEDYELDIPAIKFTDGPTGVVLGYDSTAFPVSMARGATWDVELEKRVGDIIGIESCIGGANLFAGVCINLLRHPAWGRAQETYGEDTYLLGAMGSALTEGVEKHVIPCVKHFACNSMENGRFKVNINIDDRTLHEIYLPHFKKTIDAGARCVMSAYNRVRGEWCGHNKELIRDILNDKWGFDGFVMSDFIFGIRNTVDAINGGQCIEMHTTQYFGENLLQAVKDGHVTEETIEDAVLRILRYKIKYAIKKSGITYESSLKGSAKHAEVAREVSQKGTVLLKNDGILPLKKDEIKKIIVVGPNSCIPNIGDQKGSSVVFPPYVVTPIEGLRNKLGESVKIEYVSGMLAHELMFKASQADAVIAVMGLTTLDEGEYCTGFGAEIAGGDRVDIGLHEGDIRALKALKGANKNTVVVLQGGSVLTTTDWEDSVGAILMQWYAGMEGGNALADILFGDVNPSGKMPATTPKTAQQLPYFDAEAVEMVYDFYHGYHFADRNNLEVQYPFGFGLSYTQYEYGEVTVDKKVVGENDTIKVNVTVTNTGHMDGEEVVQLYVGYVDSLVERHKKDLKGFTRVFLRSGESKNVAIALPVKEIAYYDVELQEFKVEEIVYKVLVGPSSDNRFLKSDTFEVCS